MVRSMNTVKSSIESLNLRFITDRPAQEKALSQSLNRTADELLSLFGSTCRLIINVASSPDLTIFPFVKEGNTHITENTGFDIPVYSNGHVISGDPSVSNNMSKLLSDDFLCLHSDCFSL